jgi:hypothetical protein
MGICDLIGEQERSNPAPEKNARNPMAHIANVAMVRIIDGWEFTKYLRENEASVQCPPVAEFQAWRLLCASASV